MKKNSSFYSLSGLIGKCGSLDVFLGIAPANLLHEISFADVLDEDTGRGYQRPRNKSHSLDFKKYIMSEKSSTIPLTFNLRKEIRNFWRINRRGNGTATLYLKKRSPCLAQVDCQHRLGELYDMDVPLAFMAFIGLDLRDEMAQFVIINSKSKGLSSSLTDYHQTNLLSDVAAEAPHLCIARRLNEDPESPWFRLIRYGGETTSGLKRRTSLRMMQKAIYRFIGQTREADLGKIDNIYGIIREYWKAVQAVFPMEWNDHRHHLISKGIGLHSLMRLLADIVMKEKCQDYAIDFFKDRIRPLKGKIDWTSKGLFAHAGGQKGVQEVHATLRGLLGF